MFSRKKSPLETAYAGSRAVTAYLSSELDRMFTANMMSTSEYRQLELRYEHAVAEQDLLWKAVRPTR